MIELELSDGPSDFQHSDLHESVGECLEHCNRTSRTVTEAVRYDVEFVRLFAVEFDVRAGFWTDKLIIE